MVDRHMLARRAGPDAAAEPRLDALQISPELALVCPALGEAARASLPERPWEAALHAARLRPSALELRAAAAGPSAPPADAPNVDIGHARSTPEDPPVPTKAEQPENRKPPADAPLHPSPPVVVFLPSPPAAPPPAPVPTVPARNRLQSAVSLAAIIIALIALMDRPPTLEVVAAPNAQSAAAPAPVTAPAPPPPPVGPAIRPPARRQTVYAKLAGSAGYVWGRGSRFRVTRNGRVIRMMVLADACRATLTVPRIPIARDGRFAVRRTVRTGGRRYRVRLTARFLADGDVRGTIWVSGVRCRPSAGFTAHVS